MEIFDQRRNMTFESILLFVFILLYMASYRNAKSKERYERYYYY